MIIITSQPLTEHRPAIVLGMMSLFAHTTQTFEGRRREEKRETLLHTVEVEVGSGQGGGGEGLVIMGMR